MATSRAPAAAPAETRSTTDCHPLPSSARRRYGMALPSVSAPISAPMARPRPDRNQVAAIFIAGGYTPARKTPVAKRDTTAAEYEGTATSAAVQAAAPRAE